MVKIGLIQMRSEKGAIEENLKSLSGFIARADMRGMDIIGFPELSITGYADPIKYPRAVIRLDGEEMAAVLRMTRGRKATVLAGLIEENPDGKPFITQVVIRDGQLMGYYRKRTIKDEEKEWFSPGETAAVFPHDNLTFGIALCSDIANEEVFSDCAQQGVQIIFELAAPGLEGDQAERNWRSGFQWWEGECQERLAAYAQKHGVWIAVATQAGRTVDEDFPGGAYVFAPVGRRVYATHDWYPGAVLLSLDTKKYKVTEL